MIMKIDLQIHTTFSDGMNNPEEISELAHKGGLNVISVTDHDRVDGVERTTKACTQFGIKVISGVEISTTYNGHALHILGYNIDVNNKDFHLFLKKINDFRKEKFIEKFLLLNELLKKSGKKEANIENYKNKDINYYSLTGLVRFLLEEGVVVNFEEGLNFAKTVRGTTPHVEPSSAFEAIHKAGGIAVFSHPFAPKISLKNISIEKIDQELIIKEFKEQGLDGLECYQAGHSSEDVEFCLSLAEKYNLIITAGSDWHGYHPPEDKGIREYLPYYINALGDLDVPEDKVVMMIKLLGVK